MELQSVYINGFRRFSDESTLRTHGKLVAILGPNEAGKTSLLTAIQTIFSDEEIPASDIARGKSFPNGHIILSARFRLDQDDLESAKLNRPTWYVLGKKISGGKIYEFDPPIEKRDISNRKKLLEIVEKIKNNNKLWGRLVQDHPLSPNLFEEFLQVLSSDDETLDEDSIETLSSIQVFVSNNSQENDPLYFRNFPEQISDQINFEKEQTPEEFAANAIFKRLPKILLFSESDRILKGSYSIEDLESHIPSSLENISKVANLDIRELIKYIREDDTPNITRLKSKANDTLKSKFNESWSQSGVNVAFEVLSNHVQILVQEENYNFTKLAERSDGLRQFVALQAFTTCERAEDPILLIDEAEMRLHYDAQADLIQMLSKQEVASKIIYTTHSAGCLPEDLGNGVRLVDYILKDDETSSSTIKNQFWNREEGGLAPLLFGMGAATLAFFPIRRALLTEGESDMLLLPTMLREVLESQYLSFQVVPGLSKTSGINLPILTRNGNGVAFCLDFDQGGREIEKKILSAGFSKDAIFYMRTSSALEFQIEDFINPKILSVAVSMAFRELNITGPDIPPSSFKNNDRLETIRKNYKQNKKSDIPKVLIAYKILEYKIRNQDMLIVDQKKKKSFLDLSKKISEYLSSKID